MSNRTLNIKLIKEIESAEKERRATEIHQPTDNGDDLVESFLISEDNSVTPIQKSSDKGKNTVLQATSFLRHLHGEQDDTKLSLRNRKVNVFTPSSTYEYQ